MTEPGGTDGSRELTARFDALLARLGGRPDPALASALAAAWTEPHRIYHGRGHLEDCLRQLDAAPREGAEPNAAEAALWFHDAVYDPRTGDNEARSATWGREALAAAGVSPVTTAEVARLVLLTRHLEPPDPSDATGALVCDVDLSILGRPPAEYDAFERGIRSEYAWVPEPVYRTERARILARFRERDPLYRTAHFRRRYEAAARQNLDRALVALRTEPPARRKW